MNLQEAIQFMDNHTNVENYQSGGTRKKFQEVFNWLVDNVPEKHRVYGYIDLSICFGCKGKKWRPIISDGINMAWNMIGVMK